MQRIDRDMDVTKAVVVISWVFVIYASLELESGRWYVSDDPFAIPHRIGGPSDCRSAESHVRILLMP